MSGRERADTEQLLPGNIRQSRANLGEVAHQVCMSNTGDRLKPGTRKDSLPSGLFHRYQWDNHSRVPLIDV